MLARLKFPIQGLVNEILDHLPSDIFHRSDTQFLDPAMAGGQFLREIIARLRQAGHSDDNIRDRIWGCEILNGRINYCRRFGKVISDHLIVSDFLSYDWGDMKFDVILGNPPYQSNVQTSKKLWPLFVEKSVQLLKPDGFLCMVTPASWMTRPEGKSLRTVTQDVFSKNTLLWVTTKADQHFDVGEKITAWILKNSPHNGVATTVETLQGVHNVIYQGQRVALSPNQNMLYSVLDVIERYTGETLRNVVYTDVSTTISADEQLNNKMIFNKASSQRVPVFWTASNIDTFFIHRKHIKPGIKIILNKSGYYYQSDQPTKYMKIDLTEQYGVGSGALGITCKSKQEALNHMSYLTSKLYQFYVNNEKTSGFNSGIIKLPLLNTNESWDDQKVYEFFGLTSQQIEFVENNFGSKMS